MRKTIHFHPKLLTVIRQLCNQIGLDIDQVVNLALWELGRKLGQIQTLPIEMNAPGGVDLEAKIGELGAKLEAKIGELPAEAELPVGGNDDSQTETKSLPRGMLYLQVDHGPLTPVVKDVFLIGRGSKCDHVIQHRSVSREHAVITRERSGWFIEDLNSANGTWLNGSQIAKKRIDGGEEFTIANHVIRTEVRTD